MTIKEGGGPTGQAGSLWGHIKASDMGQRVSRDKPAIGSLPSSTLNKKSLARTTASMVDLPGSYRPKTKETTVAWEYILSFTSSRIGEATREVLAAAAEECLTILGEEGRDLDKLEKVESVIGKISSEEYSQLVNLARKVTDFTIVSDKSAIPNGNIDGPQEEETEMAVVFEEEDDDDEANNAAVLFEEASEEEMEEDAELSVPIVMMEQEEQIGVQEEQEQEQERVFDEKDSNLTTSLISEESTIDLDSLAFAQGGHTMTNKKCIVPEKSVRLQKLGYEEIHIPAPTPKPLGPDEKLVPVSSLPVWAQSAFVGTSNLNRVQSRLYKYAFETDANFLLCAPTGAGKTNVALLAMLWEIGKHIDEDGRVDLDAFKIVYIAPMKALVQEMVANFTKKLQAFGITVNELTGDTQLTKSQIASTQVIVTTPEKWDVITRKNNDASYTRLVRLVIIDEIHLLHDDRGPVLEALVARTLRQVEATQQWTRIVGLSATLPNYLDVGRFLRVDLKKGIFYFDSSYRPCPLAQQFIGLTEKKPLQMMKLMNQIVYEKVMERAGQSQVLIFAHSRKDTSKTAKAIRDEAIAKGTIGSIIKESTDSKSILAEAAEQCKDLNLQELLPYGFAIHHAGMNRADRNRVEELFAQGHIQVLVSTATLAWGVNLPAHTVIIKGTMVYRPERGGWSELSSQDVLQMLGRAGRPQFDTQGEGIIITSHGELQFYLSLLNQQLPIESQLITSLVDHLNAEIVLGSIGNVSEAVEWLGYTYLYVRMLRDGALYGISPEQKQTDPGLRKFRTNLIHSAALVLDKNNLIRYDRRTGLLKSTELARIASHYYITHHSMSVYASHLKASCTEIDLLRIFSLSHEFRLIPVRMEERVELSTLSQQVPIPMRDNYDEPAAKINMLLQAFISQLKLEGFALAADMVYVTQSAGRILRALFEMCLRRGWARVAHKALALCKMVEHRQWKSMTPLRQLDGVPLDILKKLERKDFSWEHLFELSAIELGELVKNASAGKTLYSALLRFPRVTVEAAAVPLTREQLRIEMTIRPNIINKAGETFWIIIEDCDGEMIMFSDSLILRGETERHLIAHVSITEPLSPVLFVTVVADRWLGCEARLPINLTKLVLPEKRGVTTEVGEILNISREFSAYPAISSLYVNGNDDALDSIQSTTVMAAFKSDENMFVGAPSNTDTLITAEFAIHRAIIQDPKCLIVYVASQDDVLAVTRDRWSKTFAQKGVVELCGDYVTDLKLLDSGAIILASPRDWDQLSRRWKTRKAIQRLSLFIVDGIHHLSNDSILEVVLGRIRFMAAQLERPIRIVSLGLPIWNPRELCTWLGVDNAACFNFDGFGGVNVRLMSFHYIHYPSMILAMLRPALKLAKQHEKCFIYVADGKQARQIAEDLAHIHVDSGIFSKDKLPTNIKADELFIECMKKGITFYDGTIPLEQVINISLASIVILPKQVTPLVKRSARPPLVIIMGTQEYKGHEGGYADYSTFELFNMIGTCSKEAMIMCYAARRPALSKLLEAPLCLESTLDTHLADALNAEIAVKTVASSQDAIDYLTWTFLYRRLARNPNYYGLISVGQLAMSEYLSELIEAALGELENAKCVQIEKDAIASLNMGLIAAYYGVSCGTIEMLAVNLKGNSKSRTILECISAASEFDDLPMRDREHILLEKLSEKVPLKLSPNAQFNDPHVKAFLLLQAHFSRIPLLSSAWSGAVGLEEDRRFIVSKALSLIQATVDVTSSYGHLRTCLAAMECSQMLVQAIWTTDPPIKQIIDGKALQFAIEKDIKSVYDFDEELLKSLPTEIQSTTALAANRYPSLEVEIGYDSPTVTVDEEITLRVSIGRTASEGPVNAPRYPRRKEEAWWLILAANDVLLAIKRFVVEDTANVHVSTNVEQVGTIPAKAYLICDSYAGADQEFDVPFKVIPLSKEDQVINA